MCREGLLKGVGGFVRFFSELLAMRGRAHITEEVGILQCIGKTSEVRGKSSLRCVV